MFKKRIMKRCLALITVVALLGVLIVGCGKSEDPEVSQSNAIVTTAEVTAETSAKEPVKLSMWHYFNDRETIMNDLASSYEAESGNEVEMMLLSADLMKSKQQVAAASSELPDVWAFSGGIGDICRYADGGILYNIDDDVAQWNDQRFSDIIYDQMEVTEVTRGSSENPNAPLGHYALPLDTNNMQMLYNKDLFAKAGLDSENPPKTWSEFIAAGKQLKAAGIVPFASGLGSWTQISLASVFQFEFMGEENINKARTGEITFKEAGLEQALNGFVEMLEAEMFADGSAIMDLPTAEKMFVNGEVAIIFDGSWALGVFKSMNPDFSNYGVFIIPQDERAPYAPLIPGGLGAFLTVNAKSEKISETMEFLKWLTDVPQQVLYANGSLNLPANNLITNTDNITPQLLQFSSAMSKVQPTVAGEKQAIAEIYNTGLSVIINGGMTPEELVKEMDEKSK